MIEVFLVKLSHELTSWYFQDLRHNYSKFLLLFQAALLSTSQQNVDEDQNDETTSQDSNSDIIPKTTPAKAVAAEPSPALVSVTPEVPSSAATSSASVSTLLGGLKPGTVLSGPAVQGVTEELDATVPSSLANISNSVKAEDIATISDCRLSPTTPELGLERVISRQIAIQEPVRDSMSSFSVISSTGALDSVPEVSDLSKRNISTIDERMEGGSITPSLALHLSGKMQSQQVSKINDGTISNDNAGESPGIVGRTFPATSQWRPQIAAAFQSQNEVFPTLLNLLCLFL